MNKITQLLIDDIGIGKHDAIVRAMNMDKREFMIWARKHPDESIFSLSEMLKGTPHEPNPGILWHLVNRDKNEVKNQFSTTLCSQLKK